MYKLLDRNEPSLSRKEQSKQLQHLKYQIFFSTWALYHKTRIPRIPQLSSLHQPMHLHATSNSLRSKMQLHSQKIEIVRSGVQTHRDLDQRKKYAVLQKTSSQFGHCHYQESSKFNTRLHLQRRITSQGISIRQLVEKC